MSEEEEPEKLDERQKGEQRKKHAKDLAEVTSYIVGKHHAELGYPPSKNRWVGALRQRSERLNCLLSEGTIRQILRGTPGDRGDEVLGRLARVLSMRQVPKLDGEGKVVHDTLNNVVVEFVPYEELQGLTATELRLPLGDFKAWEKGLGGRRRGEPEVPADGPAGLAPDRFRSRYRFVARTDATTPLGHYELVLPARNQPLITRDQEELHYVTWRYALETRPESAMVAREVMTFRRVGNAFHATMTYKFGAHDLDQALRVFEGPVVPLGQSLMCVLTAADQTSEGWEDNFDRGRAIFLRRRPIGFDHLVRFGVMATTRADGDFEPCAACVFMLLVDAKIEDIGEYRRLVTVVRPEEEVLSGDFGGLPERDRERIRMFLNNAPEGYREHVIQEKDGAEDGDGRRGHDRVLRLQLRRFERDMPRIRDFIVDPKNGVMNPIIATWKAPSVLLAHAEEEI